MTTLRTGLLVVGAGLAGYAAALEAARLGAQVLLLEKTAQPGGSSIMSSGCMAFAGTDLQRAAGVVDSADLLRRDLLEVGQHQNDPGLVQAYAIHQGEAFLSPAISDAVLTDYRRHVSNPVDLLTSREREVLTMVADGKTNKEIATTLNLSVYTIESHRGSVMEKLNLHNTGDIVRFALRNGLIS